MKLIIKILMFIVPVVYFSASFAQNTKSVNKKALSIYSEDEINKMPMYKINQLNYLYTSSFIIPEEMKNKILPEEVDMNKYSVFRKDNERVTIDIGLEKKTGVYIILLSTKEVEESFSEIEKKTKNEGNK